MANWDSADLLARVRTEIQQPATSNFPLDTDIYSWLGAAQSTVMTRLSITVPESQYGQPILLQAPAARTVNIATSIGVTGIGGTGTVYRLSDVGAGITSPGVIPDGTIIVGITDATAAVMSQAALSTNNPVAATITPDAGFIFIFGTDADGNWIFPLGEFELYRDLTSIADSPMSPGDEFLIEGDHIRIPGNLPYAGPAPAPYARFLNPPLAISALISPVLKPVQARQCLVYEAAASYFRAAAATDNLALYQQKFEEAYETWLVAMRAQAEAMDAVAGTGGVNGQLWYQGIGGGSRWW